MSDYYEITLAKAKKISLYDGERLSHFAAILNEYSDVAPDEFYTKLAAKKPDLFGTNAWNVTYIGIRYVIISLHWD
jgi:hypothetical protein